MRTLLASNEMLAHWARAYGLPADLRAHAASVDSLRANPKVASALFEAYVGGIVEGLGMDAARKWMYELVDAQLALTPEADVPRLVAAIERGQQKSVTPPPEPGPVRVQTNGSFVVLDPK